MLALLLARSGPITQEEWLLTGLFFAIGVPAAYLLNRLGARERQADLAALAEVVRRLEIRWDPKTLSGELDGHRVEVRHKFRRQEAREAVTEVRVFPKRPLPKDFLVAPRRWLGLLETFQVPGLFEAGAGVLDQRYVFQCHRRAEGRALIAHPEVIRALEALPHDAARQGRRTPYVEQGAVGIGWTKFLSAEHSYLEPFRQALAAARALDQANESLEAVREANAEV